MRKNPSRPIAGRFSLLVASAACMALTLALASLVCAAATWTPQKVPGYAYVPDVSAANDRVAFAVSVFHDIIGTTDGGTWSSQYAEAGVRFNAVSAVSTRAAWAVGYDFHTLRGLVMRTHNGSSWTKTRFTRDSALNDISTPSAGVAWIAANRGYVYRTIDGGSNYQRFRPGSASDDFHGIAGLSPNEAWAVGDDGLIFTTADGGASWVKRHDDDRNLNAVTASGGAGWAVGDNGLVLFTTDGVTWTRQAAGLTSRSLNGVCAVNRSVVCAVGDHGTVLSTTDGGTTWTAGSVGYDYDLFGTSGAGAGTFWACGNGELNSSRAMYRTDNFVGPPNITGVEPPSGDHDTIVTVRGTSFGTFGAGCNVTFDGEDSAAIDSWTDTRITCHGPNGAGGLTDVVVTCPYGTSNAVKYAISPTITTSPVAVFPGDDFNIGGWNFGDGGAGSSVRFTTASGTLNAATHDWDGTSVGVVAPDGAYGDVTVTLSTPGGNSSVGMKIAPRQTLLNPTSGTVGTDVTVQGAGFGPERGGSHVSFDGVQATGYSSWSDHAITCKVPPGASGAAQVATTTAGGTSNLLPFNVTPHLDSIDPQSGTTGTVVTLEGSAFGDTQGASVVSFGAVDATEYTSWADDKVVCKVPAGVGSDVLVTLTTPGGTSNGLEFSNRPHIGELCPDSGTVGSEVLIKGSAFGQTQGIAYVMFGAVAVTTYNSWSDGEVSVNVPAGVSGTVDVVLTTAAGSSNEVPFYDVPQIDSIDPDSATIGNPVNIIGSGFGPVRGAGDHVDFDTVEAVTYLTWTETSIVCNVPAGTPGGEIEVTVTTSAGTSNAVAFDNIPDLESVSPNPAAVGSEVTIGGEAFGNAIGTSYVSFGAVHAVTYNAWDEDEIKCLVPAGVSGEVSLTVTTDAGTSNAMTFGVRPTLSLLDPASGKIGAPVTLTGDAFGDERGDSYVSFGSVLATSYSAWSNGSVTCRVPAGVTGSVAVTVTTGGGTSTELPFGVLPHLDGIEPDSGTTGTIVKLTGSAFGAGPGPSFVSFGTVPAVDYIAWTDTGISVRVPAGASGVIQVTVTNPQGTSNGLTFDDVPDLNDISPNSQVVGGAVTLSGEAFGAAQGASFVTFGSTDVTSVTSWSEDTIVCDVPAGVSGGVDVTVTTAGGTSNSKPLGVIPTAAGVDPPAGAVGSLVTVNGNAFGDARGSSFVSFDGVEASSYSAWSDGSITCVVPDGASGLAQVTVTTAGGTSAGVQFGVTPGLDSLDPTSGLAGSLVKINGRGFGNSRGGSFVTFGLTDASVYATWSDTEIECLVPADCAGLLNVTVTTGGGTSGPRPFSVIPQNAGILPQIGPAGTFVGVAGEAFGDDQGASYVLLGNTRVTNCPYWSDHVVSFQVPAGAKSGLVRIVTDGGTSNGVRFDVKVLKPVVTGISPSTGSPGTVVTVNGSNFGPERGGSFVTFDGTPATDYRQWGDGRIVCAVPNGASSGPVVVTTDDGASNRDKVFTLVFPSWFLAEGSTNWGFGTTIYVENPNDSQVTARLTFMLSSSAGAAAKPITKDVKLPPRSQTAVNAEEYVGNADFSTGVTCLEGRTIAVDRTMAWEAGSAGEAAVHNTVGVPLPAKNWYLPEGSSNWGFECWLLIQNPNDAAAECRVTYMIEGAGPRTLTKVVPAQSRATYNMASDVGGVDASIQVESDLPVIPERSMYGHWTPPGSSDVARREGHVSIGTTAASTSYYLAEGTTAWGFTTYVLVQNPNDREATVTLKYMTQEGPLEDKPFKMPARSRRTVRLNDIHPDADLSTQVTADVPVIAERSMYWSSAAVPDSSQAMNDTIGTDNPHRTFYLPAGGTWSKDGQMETYTLVQNHNESAVEIRVTYLTRGGGGAFDFTDTLPAGTRRTYVMGNSLSNKDASVKVECLSPGKDVVAERSVYVNNRWGGHCSIGAYSD